MQLPFKGVSMAEVLAGGSKEAETLQSALALIKEALQFLDEGNAPADIGAHLDLAIVRLMQHQADLTI